MLALADARVGLLPDCDGMRDRLLWNGVISADNAGCDYFVGIYDAEKVPDYAVGIRESLGFGKVVVAIRWDGAARDALVDLIKSLECLAASPVLIARSSDDVMHSKVLVYELIEVAPEDQEIPVRRASG